MFLDLLVLALAATALHRLWHYEEIAAPLRARVTWKGLTCTACSAMWCGLAAVALWLTSQELPAGGMVVYGLLVGLAVYPLVRSAHWVQMVAERWRAVLLTSADRAPASASPAPASATTPARVLGGSCGSCGSAEKVPAAAKLAKERWVVIKGPDDWGPDDLGCEALALHLAARPDAYVEVWVAPTSLGQPARLARAGVQFQRILAAPNGAAPLASALEARLALLPDARVVAWCWRPWSVVEIEAAVTMLGRRVVAVQPPYTAPFLRSARVIPAGVDQRRGSTSVLALPPALDQLAPLDTHHKEIREARRDLARTTLSLVLPVILAPPQARKLGAGLVRLADALGKDFVQVAFVGPGYGGQAYEAMLEAFAEGTADGAAPLVSISVSTPTKGMAAWEAGGLPPDLAQALAQAASLRWVPSTTGVEAWIPSGTAAPAAEAWLTHESSGLPVDDLAAALRRPEALRDRASWKTAADAPEQWGARIIEVLAEAQP